MIKSQSRPLLFLYIIFAYVIAFSLWWAYLLYSKNELSFKEMVELKSLSFKANTLTTNLDYYKSADYLSIHDKYVRQKKMIMSEGAFFIGILIVGLYLFVEVLKKN